MAHVTKITETGQPEHWPAIGFRQDRRWSEILRSIGAELATDGELILQRLIQFYPEILPWDQLEESSDKVCVVCQEACSANTDILLIERIGALEGRFVIVETKLSDNGEIHREVLGQVIEYAARSASAETPEKLKPVAVAYWRGRPEKFKKDFETAMEAAFDEHWDEIWHSAFDNLKKGNVRILIVADNLPADLKLAVTFFPPEVLLSAIEVQAHLSDGNNELVLTGVQSASANAAKKAHAAKERIFNGMRISLAQVRLMPDGFVVTAGTDRSMATSAIAGRPYEDHLKTLGADSVPGQVLAMLKEKTDQTLGRVYIGKAGWITFFWWNLPGLYVREKNGSLEMQFWPLGPLGVKELADKAREIFMKYLSSELQPDQRGAYLNFLPIRQDTDLENGKARIRNLELLYKELGDLRKEHDAKTAPPEPPDNGSN